MVFPLLQLRNICLDLLDPSEDVAQLQAILSEESASGQLQHVGHSIPRIPTDWHPSHLPDQVP